LSDQSRSGASKLSDPQIRGNANASAETDLAMGRKPSVDKVPLNFYQSRKQETQSHFTGDFSSKFQMVEHYGIQPSMLSMNFKDDDY
jgi:hypothetical protein